jgi:hypothetical protein
MLRYIGLQTLSGFCLIDRGKEQGYYAACKVALKFAKAVIWHAERNSWREGP